MFFKTFLATLLAATAMAASLPQGGAGAQMEKRCIPSGADCFDNMGDCCSGLCSANHGTGSFSCN